MHIGVILECLHEHVGLGEVWWVSYLNWHLLCVDVDIVIVHIVVMDGILLKISQPLDRSIQQRPQLWFFHSLVDVIR
jgi:hypothetical protein